MTVTVLPDGKRDVTVLTDEEAVIVENLSNSTEPEKTVMYRYSGNQFRTVYELAEDDIRADMEKYLSYTAEGEPDPEQLKKEQDAIRAAIDSYTMELMEGGIL